jgi:hypothetical protein
MEAMGTTDRPPSTTAAPAPSRAAPGSFDRRALVLSALLLAVAIIGGIVAVTVTSDEGDRTANQLEEGEIPPASAIPRPGRGRPPTQPGDRGGWEQLGLLGLLVTAMAGIGVVVFRGGRTARANRARWQAAGATGQDGALDRPPGDDVAGPRASP